MAHKKAAPAKPAPEKKKPAGKDAAKDRGESKEKLKPGESQVRSATGIYSAIIVCILLFFATLGVIFLYIKEVGKTADLRYGAERIAKFMEERQPQLRTKSTEEKIDAARNYARKLTEWAAKLNEVDAAIDEIKNLTKEWKANDGSLFLFHHKGKTFREAAYFCQAQNSNLTTVETMEEEDFIERHVKGTGISYWIGLRYKNAFWVWIEELPLTVVCFRRGRPKYIRSGQQRTQKCVAVEHNCTEARGCWVDSNCSDLMGSVCRRRPDKKWKMDSVT